LRNGHGSQLYQALFSQLRAQGIHTIIGCIAIPNPASIALHKKLGFKKAAHFTEVGYKFNRWLDIEYWQMIL
jgi:phosphinothricin acetyltransferase